MKVAASIFIIIVTLMLGVTSVSTAHETTTHRTFILRLANTPNLERTEAGLPMLTFDRGLNTAAQHHAEYMCSINNLEHAADLSIGQPDDWTFAGENVGVVSGVAKIRRLRAAFNKSATHRELIVEPRFVSMGFGTCKSSQGRRFVVYRFSDA